MTDDIVTRLRTTLAHADDVYDTMDQAANEIERLRAELQLAHSQIAIMSTAKVEEEPF